jgi:hypothetical protein
MVYGVQQVEVSLHIKGEGGERRMREGGEEREVSLHITAKARWQNKISVVWQYGSKRSMAASMLWQRACYGNEHRLVLNVGYA